MTAATRNRRVAANTIVTPREEIDQGYVELCNGCVVGYGHFDREMAFTEWLGGRIDIKVAFDGSLRAYKEGKELTE